MDNEELRSNLMNSSLSARTEANYRWHLKQFAKWCHENEIETPDDRIVSEFLTELFAKGYAPGTIKLFTDALNYHSRMNNCLSPVGEESRRVMRGITREGRNRGRGQPEGLTFEQYDRILDSVCEPRHELESPERAVERGRLDRAIVTLLFMGAMRRSELTRLVWKDIDFSHEEFVYVEVKHSKSNPHGLRDDVRVLSKRGAKALRDLRAARIDEPMTFRVVPLSGLTINLRFQKCCDAIGLEGQYTSHSGRVGLAGELCARGAPIQAVAIAGGWQSMDMVIHYSKKTKRERGAVAKYL